MPKRDAQGGAAGEVAGGEDVARRMFDAQLVMAKRVGHMPTLEEIGAAVAREMGRDDAYAPSVVRRWLKGLAEPSNAATWAALARVLGVRPAFLAFGEPPMVRLPRTAAEMADALARGDFKPIIVDDPAKGVHSIVQPTDLTRADPSDAEPGVHRASRRRKANGK